MKVHQLKDTMAIFWFFVIAILQYKKYYKTVLYLLVIGMVGDLIVATTNIGDKDISEYIM